MIIIILALSGYLASYLDGGKVLVGIGLGMQVLGFTSMLVAQQAFPIKDREAFDKIFHRRKGSEPEIMGSPKIGKAVSGIWLILIGLCFQIIGLFLM